MLSQNTEKRNMPKSPKIADSHQGMKSMERSKMTEKQMRSAISVDSKPEETRNHQNQKYHKSVIQKLNAENK